ncbi:MAG: hypothetical protein LKE37_04030 [Atopobiaceae bacterium]|jgi:polyphosphate:AMP phosphotransferase|nr:hypothetical protein [Atopobiaceae bacterium]
MLESKAAAPRLGKDEYKRLYKPLAERLMVLQQMARFAGLGSIVLFEGWDAAGKGAAVSDLVVNLDSRYFNVYATQDPVGSESRLPFMARFWSRVGGHGTMTIFDQGWYHAVMKSLAMSSSNDEDAAARESFVDQAISYSTSIRSFETQLAADGYLIVKIFLNIPADVQRERFMELLLDPNTSWRVTDGDVDQVQRYGAYAKVLERLLSVTDRPAAPWTVVEATHRRNANVAIMQTLVAAFEWALAARGVDTTGTIDEVAAAVAAHVRDDGQEGIGSAADLSSMHELVEVGRIEDARHDLVVGKREYARRLAGLQEALHRQQAELYRRRIPLVVAYEGWDAAGKGGNIKRLAQGLDARIYMVNPIASPTPEELARPFLWRFWTRLPRTGHTAIFDRTWYGRVLVERVEGYARPEEWRRAYDEINEFEAELERWGAILVKLWINVGSEEQLRRFNERQDNPEKRWKITPDDWRNRERNDDYATCVDDMLRLTSTPYAPWNVIESDDKRYARLKALGIVSAAIDERLGDAGLEL